MNNSLEYQNVAGWRDVSRLRLLAAVMVAIACWLAVPGLARAEWTIVGEKVPAGQVIDNDVLATGTDVVIDGTVNGDLWAVGSTVTVNGPVSGSVVALGGTVALNGEIGGSTYLAGRILRLGDTAHVARNVHFAGLLLDSQSGSRIDRDLVAASVRAHISSQVGRTLKSLILLLTLDGQIGGGSSALPPGGSLAGNDEFFLGIALGPGGGHGLGYAAPSLKLVTTRLASGTLARQQEPEPDERAEVLPGWLSARLSDLAILLLLGILGIWLRPELIEGPADHLRRKPLAAAGLGLLGVALSVNVMFIALGLLALVVVIGGWLGSISLWGLALVVWSVGVAALVVFVVLLGIVVLYGSKIIVADMLGTLILKRLAPRTMEAERRILPLILGLILYIVLRSIPILGWAIDAILTILGLGAIWVALRDRRRQTQVVGQDEPGQPVLALES